MKIFFEIFIILLIAIIANSQVQSGECILLEFNVIKFTFHQPYYLFYLNTVCSLPSDPGTCHDQAKESKRVFYDKSFHVCHQFVYSGCGGNGNNFQDETDCLRVCKGV